MVRSGLVLVLGSVMGLSAGCGGPSSAVVPPEGRAERVSESSLTQLGDLLRLRIEDTGKPPASAADLARYQKLYDLAFARVSKGDVVLIYGATLQDSSADTVLAYLKQTPESGGYVLMQDGKTVKKMTPEEFKSAPKAPGYVATAAKKK